MKIAITSAVRTAIGKFGGSLVNTPAADLAAVCIRESLQRSKLRPEEVDEVLIGNVLQAGQGQNPARQAAIKAEIPVSVPSTTINKVCGSGLKSITMAAQAIKCGDANIIVAGGTENMSRAPYLLKDARYGYRLGNGELTDSILSEGLTCAMCCMHMGNTAENIAAKYNITRAHQDAFAALSQKRAAEAIASGKFKREIVGVSLPQKKGEIRIFDTDEYVRPDSNLEGLAKLKPAFLDSGSVTAGNASGINDGASVVVVMSDESARSRGLKPLAFLRAYASVGVDPAFMGMGPVGAVQKALQKAGLKIEDIDLFELNEAFAAQSLAVLSELKLDPEKVNMRGGAIALGHPIGASGARILTTLLHSMEDQDAHLGLAALCIGGGQGIAAVVERG
ncbi:MAG TPA: acetyl-CoA C-acetyltransferase [Acidobacteriota bacterium]|nr:acetyl-CoA C-acetyltransferase [Acidobacteriota bacterium]